MTDDMIQKQKHTSLPVPPADFSAETFFSGIHWHQKWEIFPGISTPGHNPVEEVGNYTEIPADLSGKRVLDVGAWNGCFSFECERRGASEIVAFSLESPEQTGFTRLKSLLNSKVIYVQGSVYKLSPQQLGLFDVVLFLGVLYHLRYPLLAIDRIRSVSKGDVFIETHVIDNKFLIRVPSTGETEAQVQPFYLHTTPIWRQYREFELAPNDQSNWFGPNIQAVIEGFETAGFDIAHLHSWADRASFRAKVSGEEPERLRHTYEGFDHNIDITA